MILKHFLPCREGFRAMSEGLVLTPSAIYPRYALGWRRGHKFFFDAAYHSGNLAGTATMWVMGSSHTDTGSGVNCVVLCKSRSYITDPDGTTFDDGLYILMGELYNLAL